jgi:L-seryl-tRNA(Ser) seleniumtransferase
MKRALQEILEGLRAEVANGRPFPSEDVILARALNAVARTFFGLTDVINATGVLLHTGLGRAPLPHQAAHAASRVAMGASDLEVDRVTGSRGRRTTRAETMLVALTGAPAALVVNNNAAALLLALGALAKGKEVLVSRGELIEIGGEFRLPDIMSASGAKLVEVGTTNRTRPRDYERAVGPKTGLILKVHPSNYRVVGFTHTAELADLAGIAARAGVPVLFDAGSGLLDRYPGIPPEEPAVTEALRSGADLVAFSGDKLLGGPQAGILVGRADLIERLRRHPLARALRVDKMTVAALEAILRLYATDRRDEIPLWAMMSATRRSLMARARSLATEFDGATARPSVAVVGGGSLPGYDLPSAEVLIPVASPTTLAARLRVDHPPVFCRAEEDGVAFDLRTVLREDDDRLVRAIRYALEQG